ncbi:polysaccharide deacetylase family protein [Streptomyces sp. NPDC053048]|uniref:polysaccharide deacetylase family protein n=1 Tax=Streptomyces sp. NPDC053048 TaxID=3365694 RepID=UPI0037D29940
MPHRRRVGALTFNAAWNEEGVGTALNVLRRHRAPATFFLTGDFAEPHPTAARPLASARPRDRQPLGPLPRPDRRAGTREAPSTSARESPAARLCDQC